MYGKEFIFEQKADFESKQNLCKSHDFFFVIVFHLDLILALVKICNFKCRNLKSVYKNVVEPQCIDFALVITLNSKSFITICFV